MEQSNLYTIPFGIISLPNTLMRKGEGVKIWLMNR